MSSEKKNIPRFFHRGEFLFLKGRYTQYVEFPKCARVYSEYNEEVGINQAFIRIARQLKRKKGAPRLSTF